MSKIYQCSNCGAKQSTEQTVMKDGDSHHSFLIDDEEVSIIKASLIIAGTQTHLQLDGDLFLSSSKFLELLNRVDKIQPY